MSVDSLVKDFTSKLRNYGVDKNWNAASELLIGA
jgi:hypothetical protein